MESGPQYQGSDESRGLGREVRKDTLEAGSQ